MHDDFKDDELDEKDEKNEEETDEDGEPLEDDMGDKAKDNASDADPELAELMDTYDLSNADAVKVKEIMKKHPEMDAEEAVEAFEELE